jgi:NTE family protein
MESKSLGICLSGGGARGAAHIGVLKALEEHDIRPTHVSGSSAGSLIGSLYAYGHSPLMIWKIVVETNILSLIRIRWGAGLMDLSSFRKILPKYFAQDSFEGFLKPMFICISNLNSGQSEIVFSGPLFSAIQASCAVPFVFKPVEIGDSLYVDGGLLNNLPAEPLRYRCDKVIGVNVIPVNPKEKISGFVDLAERSIDMIIRSNTESRIPMCDVFLEIDGIDDYAAYDIGKLKSFYELGYQHTIKRIDEIKALLE